MDLPYILDLFQIPFRFPADLCKPVWVDASQSMPALPVVSLTLQDLLDFPLQNIASQQNGDEGMQICAYKLHLDAWPPDQVCSD